MTVFLKSISVKLRIAFIVMLSILCLLVFLLFDYLQFSKVSTLLDNMYDHPVTVSKAVNQIELNIVLIHREMKDIALGKDLKTAESVVEELHDDTLKRFDILHDRFLGDLDEIQKLEQLFIDWAPIRQKVFNYRSLNRPDLAYNITISEGANHIQRLTAVVSSIKHFAENKLDNFYKDTKYAAFKNLSLVLILTALAIIMFLIASYFVAQSINSQLEKLSSFSKQVSEGDLSAEIEITGNNEIDDLSKDVVIMRDSLKQQIFKTQTSNKQLLESEKLAALGGLVAGVAHEVNTPLGISITATSVIKDIRDDLLEAFKSQTLTSAQFEDLMERLTISSDMLDENLNRGTRLIHDFKLTAVDQITDSKCSFNLKEILKALLSSLYPETRKVPVVPVLMGNDEVMMISHPGAITQIVSNLVVNSARHAFFDQSEPDINISFRESGNNIILEYRDNGCGIDSSLHEKVFEPFFSTNRANGLGLNLVDTLIHERLKGNMSFTSSRGQGVHFVFTIPQELENENGLV
ncbi:HAMP domain-containing histidine kinase [Vibrio sp. JC009]|nr:HAMP domain-containing sensor histidine kinase [Vibrio sp. JC009]WED24874.1 HAMP domain-containing histidine kinase [Vibrio sp. JC009]